jgi:hypothetical protein
MARIVPQAGLPGAAAAAVLCAAVQRIVSELRIVAVPVDAVLLGRISTGQLTAPRDARGMLRSGIRPRDGAGRVRAAGLGLLLAAGLVRRRVPEPVAKVVLGQVIGLVAGAVLGRAIGLAGGVAPGQAIVPVADMVLGQAVVLLADMVLG